MPPCLLSSKPLPRASNLSYILILFDLYQNPSGRRLVMFRTGSRACLDECFGWLEKQQTAGRKRYKWLILIQYVLPSWFLFLSLISYQPPIIWTVLEGRASNSPADAVNERQRFLKTHMTEVDNILEILLRLVRGETATPFSSTTP